MTDHDDERDRDPRAERIDAMLRERGVDYGYHFDRAGQPITFGQWAVLFEDKQYQIVEQTWTVGGAWVSTVWLGLFHGWDADGAPLIFETMAWNDGGDVVQERYASETEARAGHAAMVARYGGPDADQTPRPRPGGEMTWPDEEDDK